MTFGQWIPLLLVLRTYTSKNRFLQDIKAQMKKGVEHQTKLLTGKKIPVYKNSKPKISHFDEYKSA